MLDSVWINRSGKQSFRFKVHLLASQWRACGSIRTVTWQHSFYIQMRDDADASSEAPAALVSRAAQEDGLLHCCSCMLASA